MTTEEMIEEYISKGVKAYKKLNRNTPEGRKLERKEPVTIEGIEFSCWREYATYKVAECIHETLPEVKIDVELDGNNSTIQIEVDKQEQRTLNHRMYKFLTEEIN